MKRTNKLSKVMKKFCKLTDGLAHKDCPDNCHNKITKEIPKDRIRILERCELQINLKKEQRDNLYFFWVMDEGFKSEPLKYKDRKYFEIGEYDEKKALKECAFIRMKFADYPDNPDPEAEGDIWKLRDCLRQMRKRKEEGRFFGLIKPKPISEIEAYLYSKKYFGSDIKFKRLKDEIEDLVGRGIERNNKILNKLRKNHGLYLKDEYKNFDIVGDLWDSIEDELINQLSLEIINHQLSPEIINKLNPENINQLRKEIIKQLREERKFFKGHQPLKRKRMKEIKKPFQFNMSQVLVARKMKIISQKESQVLKFRYNLEGQETKSLRWVAGLLGKSHTTVRNMEKRAPKKMKEHIEEIKKFIPMKEPLGREATPKEYKEMSEYYSDLGKK